MSGTLRLVAAPGSEKADAALRGLAEFLGVACSSVPVTDLFAGAGNNASPCAISALGLRLALALPRTAATGSPLKLLGQGTWLIHGFNPSPDDVALLQGLTDNAVAGVAPVPPGSRNYSYSEALDRRKIPFAGLAQSAPESHEVCSFEVQEGDPRLVVLVTVNGRALFVRLDLGGVRLYLLSAAPVADLDERRQEDPERAGADSRLLPAAIFLRTVFGTACWTDPFPAANLVIDDPMIRPRYGFVEYHRLIKEANTHNFSVTIAFIPFNFDRTDPSVAIYLRGHGSRFSLAVHGYDHTAGEYGSGDGSMLAGKSRLALSRMRKHEELTGMPFDPVMVFPQGVFSRPAMEGLKRTGYDAAVNTIVSPVTGADAPPLHLRDLLDGAITAYSGFPLFSRRYPRSIFDFAVDLFWGKPVLLVEHHGYFKDGYAHLAGFVRQLGELHQNLDWKPLGEIVTGHALFRLLDEGRFGVKFFSPSFRLRNPSSSSAIFLLEKEEPESGMVDRVEVNGRPAEFELGGGKIRGEIALPGSGRASVRVIYRKTPPSPFNPSLKYRCFTASRRYLSDFRDNYIARNARALAFAVKLKNLLK